MQKFLLSLLLLIGAITFSVAQDQSFYLKLLSKDTEEQKILNSFAPTSNYKLDTAKQTINLINELLYKEGYLALQTFSSVEADTIFYHYTLNTKIKYAVVSNELLTPSEMELLKLQKTNHNFNFKDLDSSLKKYTQLLDKKGLGTSSVALVKHQIKSDTLFCALQVTLKQSRVLNQVIIVSEQKLPESIIQQSTKRYINRPYSEELIEEVANTVNDLDFVTTYKTPETLFTETSTSVYLYLNKRKTNSFDGFGGFYTDKENKVNLTGQLNLELNNVFNAGESLLINWQSNADKQTQLDLAGSFIYLFKTPINLDVNLNIQKQDTTFQNTRFNLKAGYSLSYHQKIQLGYLSNSSATNSNVPTIQNYTGYFYSLNYSLLKKRNNLLAFPINYQILLYLGTGKRTSETEATIQQELIEIELSKNFKINDFNYFYVRWQYHSLFSSNYFTNELFRFGGNQSLRGFQENSLLANEYHLINTEYRLILHPSFYLNTLFDYAIQNNKLMQQNNKLYSFGFGLGFLTKSNHFKLSFANGKQPNTPLSFDNTMIHISFKTLF